MKTLILLRHAKTENGFDKKDIDRCLTEKGLNDSKKIASTLNNIKIEPQLVISSNSVRTHQTSSILIENMHSNNIELLLNKNLYNASANQLINEIEGISNSYDCVMVVAHNPGISDLVNVIKVNTTFGLPPGGMAIFEFNTDDWNGIFNVESNLSLLSLME
jgi:phosphohistidine phosphatase